jgi:hypothetical protein
VQARVAAQPRIRRLLSNIDRRPAMTVALRRMMCLPVPVIVMAFFFDQLLRPTG